MFRPVCVPSCLSTTPSMFNLEKVPPCPYAAVYPLSLYFHNIYILWSLRFHPVYIPHCFCVTLCQCSIVSMIHHVCILCSATSMLHGVCVLSMFRYVYAPWCLCSVHVPLRLCSIVSVLCQYSATSVLHRVCVLSMFRYVYGLLSVFYVQVCLWCLCFVCSAVTTFHHVCIPPCLRSIESVFTVSIFHHVCVPRLSVFHSVSVPPCPCSALFMFNSVQVPSCLCCNVSWLQ